MEHGAGELAGDRGAVKCRSRWEAIDAVALESLGGEHAGSGKFPDHLGDAHVGLRAREGVAKAVGIVGFEGVDKFIFKLAGELADEGWKMEPLDSGDLTV